MAIREARGITISRGTPQKNEGQNGDITIRSFRDGLRMFVKESNSWHSIDLDVNLKQLVLNVQNLEKKIKELSTKRNNFPVADKLLLKQTGGAAAVQIKNDAGKIAFRNSADSADITLKNPKLSAVGDGSDSNPVINTEVSNRVTLGFNDASADFFLRLVGTGSSFDNAIQFFTGAAGKWVLGYNDSSNTVFRINPGVNLDADVLQLTSAGNLTVDGTVTANSVTLTGAPTKTDIDALDITEVGALDSGSITSGFGAIDNGSSNITTTGALDISGGTLTTSAAQKKTIIEGAGSNVDFGPYDVRSRTLQSDVATGTAPLTIASTTVVANLNADKLDGADLVDEDDMSSDSATKVPTQQSVKAYVDANSGTLSTEQVQDIVGAMFTSNTETRVSATYEDSDGTIDLVVDDMTADTNTNQLTIWNYQIDSGSTVNVAHGQTLQLSSGNGIELQEDAAREFTVQAVNASASAKGVVELATTAETTTGTDTARAVTPDGLKDGYQGSSNVTTLGTIGTGTWNGTAIANDYVAALPTSKITSGTFDDARIAASNVTQHQNSLTSATVTGATLTASPTGDTSLLKLTQTLNVASGENAGLATEKYGLIHGVITNTDSAGFDRAHSIRMDTGGAQKFTVDVTGPVKIAETASAVTDDVGMGQIWVKNDTPNNLYFTNDAGNDVQITNGSSLAGGSSTMKHYMDWHYNSANLSSTNTFYANTHIDDFGISSSINTGITDYNDTEATDIWRIVRFARRIPYAGTITKVITHVESSGASADSDIEVGVWIASISSLSLDTQLATTTNVAIDNLAKIDFDFDTATRFMFKETTSFNATSLTAGDFMFITLRRTSGTDGSSFNCHTTVLYDGS
tara:strand:+ start:18900 stop:21482 length:2583 start_codon:yes stop_codon:yes gene_type:complete